MALPDKLARPYWVALHLALVAVSLILAMKIFGGSDRQREQKKRYFHEQNSAFHARIDEMLPEGCVLFFGDSAIHGLYVNEISPVGVNFGIGGDKIDQVGSRIESCDSLSSASAVVVWTGFNDLAGAPRELEEIMSDYTSLINSIPKQIPIVCVGLPPVDEQVYAKAMNSSIDRFNGEVEKISRAREEVSYLDPAAWFSDEQGHLRRELHVGDGVHLNLQGRRLAAFLIRKALNTGGVPGHGS